MIFVTGDIHGEYGIERLSHKNWKEGKILNKNDILIILGDFGLIWNDNETENYWLNWLDGKPWTTLFIDGNHENFDLLYKYPIQSIYKGIVHIIRDSIFHLMRGEIFNIQGNKIFVFGGARSEDKNMRAEYISWWKEEEPNIFEYNNGLVNLSWNKNKVDYIFTHTAPQSVIDKLERKDFCGISLSKPYQLTNYLDDIKNKINFKKWFIGHFHIDDRIINNRFYFLYENIIRID